VGRVGSVAENVIVIRERIARAAERAGRSAGEIRLVAVTKTQPASVIRAAAACGVREIGENYIQEAEEKFRLLEMSGGPGAGNGGVTRHFIGHLQRNKAGRAAALFDVVQSVDSVELARALGRRAGALGRTLEALIEVNISGEDSKFGIAADRALDLAAEVAPVPGVRLLGLMGIGPLDGDEGATRRSFQLLAELFGKLPAEHRRVLSMGMTGDFELAIAEGSTMVRIGTGIFGARRSS
jgi:pyridoxal phosphate enzyme (YggS family)